MPQVVTTGANVTCEHRGLVILTSSAKFKVLGKPVLLENQADWSIIACSQESAGGTACKKVKSLISGKASKLKLSGVPVLLDGFQATSDGLPTKGVMGSATQTKLSAK